MAEQAYDIPDFEDPLFIEGLGTLSGAEREAFIAEYLGNVAMIEEAKGLLNLWGEEALETIKQLEALDALYDSSVAEQWGLSREDARQLLLATRNRQVEAIAGLKDLLSKNGDPMASAIRGLCVDRSLDGIQQVFDNANEVAAIESSEELGPDSLTAIWDLNAQSNAILDGNVFKMIGDQYPDADN